ncbi:hypothetical protein CO726_18015 [Bacillus fungorum]|uniref:Uncharacterized protein n=1 Tax=Bacillus fungorum TaxID=2039284 RepID=A0A2G6QCC7_9BACI|nr:hypothetical protein CO726_18015 [Bacillus fungorum]
MFGFGRRTLNKQAELLLKIDKGRESVLMRVQEIPIRKHIVGDVSILAPHAKSIQDFIQFFDSFSNKREP